MKIDEYFNSTPAKSLATVDLLGQPNVCLCGASYMPDEKTIHIGVGFFEKSLKNIVDTKKATFLAAKPTTPEFWEKYEKTGTHLYPAGYRYYCKFVEVTDDSELLLKIQERLRPRIGNRVPDALKKVLIFEVENVQELVF